MSGDQLPTAEESRALLEGHNDALIRKQLEVDPGNLSEEEYRKALQKAMEREAEYAPGTLRDHDGPVHAYFVEAINRGLAILALEDTGELLVYRNGVYRANGEAAVRGWVERRYHQEKGNSPHHHLVNEVVQAVRRRTYVPREGFNPPGKLCMANGVLDLETLSLSPHSLNLRFTLQLPAAYDPEAECPRFLRFLEEILPEAEARGTVQMLFGYCLVPGNWLQRAFMAVGSGNNGKSTLLGILADLLGPDAVSSETLQRLSMTRFATANLWGKLANIAADIPSAPLHHSGIFKMLTGGDILTGERKFRDAFSFVNGAKLIFSANELPRVDDRTYAFWRRWRLIEFTQDFTGREDRELPGKLRAELSGVFNWAIEGLRRLRERGDIPEGTSAVSLMEEWKRRSDSLYWFVQRHVEVDREAWIVKADFYEIYAAFCEDHDTVKYPPEKVGRELPGHIPQVRAERKRVEGRRPSCWMGITLKAEDPDHPRLTGQGGQGGQGGPASPNNDLLPDDVDAEDVLRCVKLKDRGHGVPKSAIVYELSRASEREVQEGNLAQSIQELLNERRLVEPRPGVYRLPVEGRP